MNENAIYFLRKKGLLKPDSSDFWILSKNNKRYNLVELFTEFTSNTWQPEYLVRTADCHIFEVDPENGCYRSRIKYSDGSRPKAMSHFTFEYLTNNFEFIPIDKKDIPKWEAKHEDFLDYTRWYSRSDGHGGVKGGTWDEYQEHKKK